jgi:O-antigen ligase
MIGGSASRDTGAISAWRVRAADSQLYVAAVALTLVAGAAIADGGHERVAVVGAAGLAGLILAATELRERAVLAWVIAAPIAYPFFRYPHAGQAITFDRIAIALILGLYLLAPPMRRKRHPAGTALLGSLLLFSAVYGLRTLFTPGGVADGLSAWGSGLLLPAAIFVVTRGYIANSLKVESLLAAVSVAGGIVAAFGIAESIFGFNLASFSSSQQGFFDANIGVVRAAGPYGNVETYEVVLAIALAATLGWMKLTTPRARILGIPLIALMLIGLLLGYTRAGWIAAGVVLLLGVWELRLRPGRILALLATGLAIYAGVQLLISADSKVATRVTNQAAVASRFATYEQGWSLAGVSPIFGVGADQYTQAANRSVNQPVVSGNGAADTSHDMWLDILVELGVVGLLALLLVCAATGRLLSQLLSVVGPGRQGRVCAMVAIASSAAYVIVASTAPLLPYDEASAAMLMLVLGCAAGMLDRTVGTAPAVQAFEPGAVAPLSNPAHR